MTPGQPARRLPIEGTKARIQRALKLSLLFERASPATRETAVRGSEIHVVPAGTVVISQGTPPTVIVIVGRGRARVERLGFDGRVIPLGYRGSGDLLGEAALGRAPEHTASATTIEESELVHIPLGLFRQLLAEDPGMAPLLFGLLLAGQREAEDRIDSLLHHNVEARLIDFLLKAGDRWGVPVPMGTLISAPLTHLEIARTIGSTRETVTLALGALRRENLLDTAGRRLIIKDRAALAQRCS